MSQLCSVASSSLRVGVRVKAAVYDERQVLLLAEGKEITPTFREKLLARGIANVLVPAEEVARISGDEPSVAARSVPEEPRSRIAEICNPLSDTLDREIARGAVLGLPSQGPALRESLVRHGAERYDDSLRNAFAATRERSVREIQSFAQSLAGGDNVSLDTLQEVAGDALDQMIHDRDLFGSLGVNPCAGEYPGRHSLHTAMLAMAVGSDLRLDRDTLRELAIGCLVHDVGMLLIKPIHEDGRRLDPVQFLEITKHPVAVFELLLNRQGIPRRSAYVAYQVHERCNGSGYPRRRHSAQIHFLSRIAAVADAYVGLVTPRAYRPAVQPYRAMEQIIRQAAAGLFDPAAVRALLTTVSLFPLGSGVELSDGRQGRVLRSNGGVVHRPVVEVWDPRAATGSTEVIDLKAAEELTIVRVLDKTEPPASEDGELAGAATALVDHWT